MKLAIGCDHGGVNLKEAIINYLNSKGVEFKDFGVNKGEACDYPDVALEVAEEVAAKKYEFGILICGTGIGISIAANKVPGIRAAVCGDTFSAHACREHNDANILALGERVIGAGLALDIVEMFLKSGKDEPIGERHLKRISKITAIEKKYNK